MKFIYTITFLLLYGVGALAQNPFNRNHTLENSIEKYAVADTASIHHAFDKAIGQKDNFLFREDLVIVKSVLLASARARTLDALNPQSDTLFLNALQTAQKLQKSDLYIWANIEYGFYLYTYRLLAQAMPFFVRALHDIDHKPQIELLQAANSFKKIAYFITTLGDHEQALKYLKRAQDHVKPGSVDSGDILNAIGHCYLSLKDYPKAEDFYQQSLAESKKSRDYIRQAKTLGSMAEIYRLNHQYEKAEETLKQDILLSSQYNNPQNTMYAQIQLTRLMLEQDKLAAASTALHAALSIAQTKTYFKSSEYEIVKLQVLLARKFGKEREELLSRRRLDTLEKQISLTDGKGLIQQVSIETQKEVLNLSLEAEQVKLRQEALLRNAVVVISLLLLLILMFIIITYRRRNKLRLTSYENRVMKLQLEKVTSENRLNETRKTLSAYREYLSEKNSQIETLQQEIKNSKNSSLSSLETSSGKLEELLQSHLMSESNWQAFKEVFIQEEPLYYQYIQENFEGLTDSNLRILFLQKMGFNNPRIAQILGITLDAVKKNKQRMRKKYGLRYTEYHSADRQEEEDQYI